MFTTPILSRLLALAVLLVLSSRVLAQDAPLTITRAIALAVERNERTAVAQTTIEAAEARLRQARSFFLPQVDINTAYRNDSASDTRQTLQSNAVVNQPLFNARAFPLVRQLRLEREATQLTAAEIRRLLGYDAADAFLVTLSFESVLLAAGNRREFARTSLEDVRARFEAGLVSSNDVTRAELELATAEREVAQAAGNVESSRIDLGNLLNEDVREPLQVPSELLTVAASTTAVDAPMIAAAQQRRNDIAAARARVAGLREFASEPSARFIPSLSLSAQTRDINDGPISTRNQDGFVGVAMNWQLFDAGLRSAQRAERTAIARGADLELQQALRDVDRQLRGSAVRLSTEQAALRQATAATTAARKNAAETNALYREGLATALELADANRQLFEAEVAEVTARFRMAQAYLALREASGVPATGD